MLLICYLRSKWVWIDYLLFAAWAVVPIILWITTNFWIAFIFASLYGWFLNFVGLIDGYTEVKKFGHTYHLKCNKCNYDGLEILREEVDGVSTKCERCKSICHWHLK